MKITIAEVVARVIYDITKETGHESRLIQYTDGGYELQWLFYDGDWHVVKSWRCFPTALKALLPETEHICSTMIADITAALIREIGGEAE